MLDPLVYNGNQSRRDLGNEPKMENENPSVNFDNSLSIISRDTSQIHQSIALGTLMDYPSSMCR